MSGTFAIATFFLALVYTFVPAVKKVTPSYHMRRSLFLWIAGILLISTAFIGSPSSMKHQVRFTLIAGGSLALFLGTAYMLPDLILRKYKTPSS